MSNPFVIITLGPTGAGKSRLVEKTIEDCGLAERVSKCETFPVFRVDDLVTQRDDYKSAVQGLQNLPTLPTISTPRGYDVIDLSEEDVKRYEKDVETYTEAYKKALGIIGKAYNTSRKNPRCYSPTDTAILTPNHTADDDKFYKIRKRVLENKITKTNEDIITLKAKQETEAIRKEEDELEKLTNKLEILTQKYHDKRTTPESDLPETDLPESDLSNYNCNDINDFKILRAISKGISFSFEITGQTYPKHYLSWFKTAADLYPELNYDIYISGVFVPSFRDLLTRNLSRYQQELKNFNRDKTLPAPRLPELSDIMHKNILTIINNIKLMHTRMTGKNEENITRLLLYSNIRKLELKFDSQNMTDLDGALDQVYNTTTQIVQQVAKTIGLKEISPKPMLLGMPISTTATTKGGRRRTSKTYKQRRRTQNKRNNKRNYNTKKTRNKRRKW